MPHTNLTREELERQRLGGTRGVAERTQVATVPQGGGFFGGFADAFRSVVPQGFRDVGGFALNTALSGERALNVLLPGDPGTAIRSGLERVPRVGGFLGTAFDVAAAPATLIPGAAGGRLAIAAGRGLGGRVAAEAAVALGATGTGAAVSRGLQEAEERGLPVPGVIQVGAPLLAGLLTAGRISRGVRPRPTIEVVHGPAAEPLRKLTELVQTAKPLSAQVRAAQRTERGVRAARGAGVLEAGGGGESAFRQSIGSLRGELPRGQFDAPRGQFVQEDIDLLFRTINEHGTLRGSFYDKLTPAKALMKTLDGQVPTRGEIASLEDVFGSGVVKALLDQRPRGQQLWDTAVDLANLPRAIMASFDISAPFRQGIVLATRKEFWGAWKPMIQAFAREDWAKAVDDAIRSSPRAGRRETAGLFLHKTGAGARLGEREEAYMSRIASNLPGIKRSERAFVTFLNKLRADVFDNVADKMARAGAEAGDYEELAKWLNVATGRGRLPASALADATTSIFFAPRLLAARIETPFLGTRALVSTAADLAGIQKLSPAQRIVRRQVARDMVGFVGAGVGALTMLNLAGSNLGFPVSIEMDPRSSDFGKGRIGSIRYDPWGGFQPIARYIAQFISGERKTSGGDIVSQDRGPTVGRFAQSKLAPAPGLLVDLIRGETFLGEDVGFTPKADLSDEITSRMVPLFLQDLVEAANEEGLRGAFMALPGATGVGVQAYRTTADVRNELAGMVHSKPWDALTGQEQQAIEVQFAPQIEGARKRSEFDERKDETEESAREQERQAAALLEQGADPRAINELLSEINRERVNRINQSFKDFGFAERDDGDPVSRIFAEREQAVNAGIVDFQLMDQITDNLLSTMSLDDQRQWDQRRRFIHDPAVQDIFDARQAIKDAGYWGAQRESFERFLGRIQTTDPSIQTYLQLEMAVRRAELEGNRGRKRRLNGIKTQIDKRTKTLRDRLRFRDDDLDAALVTVYGLVPIRSRRR